MTCARCHSDRQVAFAHRLGERVCWRCYHCTFTAEELAEAKRVERQRALAQVIRGAAGRANGGRRRSLRHRALLIETTDSVDEVLALIGEVQDLGVTLEVRR